MEIIITSGTGHGKTKLAAFDSALLAAGIGNYNLLYLSSIIPSTAILTRGIPKNEKAYGNRLYVVMSSKSEDSPGCWAWAGIGWVRDKVSRRGVFAEHSDTQEESLLEQISQSLQDMARNRDFDDVETGKEIVGIECAEMPVCALVAAVFHEADWV